MKKSRKIEKREPVHRLPLSWQRSRHAKAARDFRLLIPPASQATRKISLWLTGGHSNRLRLTLRKQTYLTLAWCHEFIEHPERMDKPFPYKSLKITRRQGGLHSSLWWSLPRDTCWETAPLSDRFRLYNVGSPMTRHLLKITWKWCNAKKLVRSQFTREFKIRRLRTTTTVKHATAHNQNHVTVHFSRVVLRLRWVVELFRVVWTTENVLLVFCRLGNSRIPSFRKKVFNLPALSEREAKYVSCG